MVPRATGLVVTLISALLLAGCGGGGDPTAFASATDRTCRDVATAVTTLRQGLVREPGTSEGAALGQAIGTYAGSIEGAAKRLEDVKSPKDDREFQQRTVKRLREHAKQMKTASNQARKGTFSSELATELQQSGPAAIPVIPKAILEDAPACRAAVR